MTSLKTPPDLSAQVSDAVAGYLSETLKHLQGKHNQKRHAWRYGANATLGKLKRQRRGDDESEWTEYKARARGKTGGKKPGGGEKPPAPTKPQTRGEIVAAKIRAIGPKFDAKAKEQAYVDAVKANNEKVKEANHLWKELSNVKKNGSESEYAAALGRYEKAHNEAKVLYKEASKRKDAYEAEKEAISLEYAQALRVDDPVSIPYNMDRVGKSRQEGFNQTVDAVGGMVSKSQLPGWKQEIPEVQITTRGANRNSYIERDRLYQEGGVLGKYKPNEKGMIAYGPQVQIKTGGNATLAHELGHHLEHSIPGFKDKVKAFLDKRTAGEKLQHMDTLDPGKGYKGNEWAKPDKFISPYMGKIYTGFGGGFAGSEIISMGIEYLLNNPIKLLNDDPEYFYFMINLLQGD